MFNFILFSFRLTDRLEKVPQECNCTTINKQPLSINFNDSHEPLNLDLLQKFQEKSVHLSEASPSINIGVSTTKRTFGPAENYINSLHKTDKNYLHRRTRTAGYPLFLDLDLQTSLSKPSIYLNFKEYFKNVFEKIRASETHVNECTDLHIFIFSKNNDNIKITHTNWGHHVTHDNLTRSEVLTEILNKCDHPVTIIRESVYEIKKRKYLKSTNKNNLLDEDKYKSVPDNLSSTPSIIALKNIQRNFENKNVQETTTFFTTVIDSGKIFRNRIENHDKNSISKRSETDEVTRKPIHHNGLRPIKHMEKDLLIPKIITREYANNTITSVVDGFELIPNQDFENIRKAFQSVDDHIDDSDQTNLIQDKTGNLHISMDNNPIPARFILNSKGEMQLAFDGLSLCNQMTKDEKEKKVFMKLLCECIQFHNCSH